MNASAGEAGAVTCADGTHHQKGQLTMTCTVSKAAIPEDLLAQGDASISSMPNWYAVYVKSRHEFIVLSELRQKQIEAFLPSVKKSSQWKDRKKIVEYPLFPGYVFVQVIPYPESFLNVLKTRSVVTLISQEPGVPTAILPEEMHSLKRLLESGREIDVYPHLMEGMRVRVKSGPLAGVEGILSSKENEYNFHVNVELLGRSVGVRVAPNDIEAV
jgi:transcriptional antiterminator NusG